MDPQGKAQTGIGDTVLNLTKLRGELKINEVVGAIIGSLLGAIFGLSGVRILEWFLEKKSWQKCCSCGEWYKLNCNT